MSNCNCTTDTNRDGSSQLARYLKALDPTYNPIDDRSIEELLVFAKRYAGQIRFYDVPESQIKDGVKPEKVSWREFFRRDMAVIAASIAVLNVEGIKKEYDELRARLDEDPSPEKFAALFNITLGIAVRIDRWYTVAIPENPLRTDLDLAIDSNLRWQMKRIIAYEEGFKLVDAKNPLKLDYSGIENDTVWGLTAAVDPDATIYEGGSTDDKIRNAALYVDELFGNFYNFISNLIAQSDRYMTFALEQYPAHQPHMALFITFLKLFGLAQQQINGLTERMLNFYYKDVLHLTPKDAIPDKAHIVFELAKDVMEYDVAKDTPLSAGKDAGGKEQVYTTGTDIVVNQAKVKELKTIFIEKLPAIPPQIAKTIKSIYARPVANSADGYGEPFTDPSPKWPTFGKGLPVLDTVNNVCDKIDAVKELLWASQPVQTGFAIATPQLLMQGGKRLVTLKLDNIQQLFPNAAEQQKQGKSIFEINFTGAEGWLKVSKVMSEAEKDILFKYLKYGIFNPADTSIDTCYYLDVEKSAIYIYLPVSAQAVIAFDAKLHAGYGYDTHNPVMQLLLNPEINLDENSYKNFKVTRLSIQVKVGSINPSPEIIEKLPPSEIALLRGIINYHFDGLKKLVIQNEDEIVKAGKSFNPFTHYPIPGKSLYIGSEEVFNKPLGELAINIRKTQQRIVKTDDVVIGTGPGVIRSLANERLEEYAVSVLQDRSWEQLSDFSGGDFAQSELTFNILNHPAIINNEPAGSTPVTLKRHPIIPITEWTPQAEKGFIRIDNLRTLATVQGQSNFQASQNLAPELEIKEIAVSYDSQLIRLENGTDQFFHVYPFGTVETLLSTPTKNTVKIVDDRTLNINANAISIRNTRPNELLVNAGNILLPQYTYLNPYTKYNWSPTTTKPSISSAQDNVNPNNRDLLTQLMVNASGIAQRTSGGNNQYSALIQEEGMLFIGIEKAKPLQSLSLLFQFAEGSAQDEDNDPPQIHWSYLTHNQWRPLNGEDLISDSTYGFQTTGIVKLNIPADATNVNSIITNGLHWFMASVTENAHRIPYLISVVSQAVEVVFADQENDPSHYDKALPAEIINKLSVKVAEISAVKQPFASFDGKPKEIGKEFYTRVSERLRHKGRAITAWDYEHLVLNRFSSIYKVKCITHTDPNCLCRTKDGAQITTDKNYGLIYNSDFMLDDASTANLETAVQELTTNSTVLATITAYGIKTEELAEAQHFNNRIVELIVTRGIARNRITTVTANGAFRTANITLSGYAVTTEKQCCGPQVAPGHVLIVPIANLKNRNALNPLQPKTSRRTLLEIEAYLKKLTSPFVKIHAKNPVYEQIIVGFRVKFYSGTDKGFYLKRLNEEIVHYLTPWAFDENAEVSFAQKIYASSIINFIEERPYVDFIADFIMGVCKDECCPKKENNKEDGDPGSTVRTSDSVAEILAEVCGCNELNRLIQEGNDKKGDVIAAPSTARSILVSVPQHIIIPYDEPVRKSPCEERKETNTRLVTRSGASQNLAVTKPVTAKTEKIKDTTKEKTAAEIKKAPVDDSAKLAAKQGTVKAKKEEKKVVVKRVIKSPAAGKSKKPKK